jgi:hypothetical protein
MPTYVCHECAETGTNDRPLATRSNGYFYHDDCWVVANTDMTDGNPEARSEFVNGLAELFSAAIRAGVTEPQLRADFEACLSVQMFEDERPQPEGAWQCSDGHMFRYEPPPASPPWCGRAGCHASGSFVWIIKDEVPARDWLPEETS